MISLKEQFAAKDLILTATADGFTVTDKNRKVVFTGSWLPGLFKFLKTYDKNQRRSC